MLAAMRPLTWLLLLAVSSTAYAEKKLDYPDFWSFAGVTHDDTAETVLAKWGASTKDTKGPDGHTLTYDPGLSVELRDSGGIQITMSDRATAFAAAHPGPATNLLGQTCKQAGARLAFVKKPVPTYLTCKRYDKSNWVLDVTLMCSLGKVSMVVVVWEPLPKNLQMASIYGDHCNK